MKFEGEGWEGGREGCTRREQGGRAKEERGSRMWTAGAAREENSAVICVFLGCFAPERCLLKMMVRVTFSSVRKYALFANSP